MKFLKILTNEKVIIAIFMVKIDIEIANPCVYDMIRRDELSNHK